MHLNNMYEILSPSTKRLRSVNANTHPSVSGANTLTDCVTAAVFMFEKKREPSFIKVLLRSLTPNGTRKKLEKEKINSAQNDKEIHKFHVKQLKKRTNFN